MVAGMEFMIRLGVSFETSFLHTGISVKFYPCCFLSHFAIDAMLRLVRNDGIRPEDVQSILVRVTQSTYNVVCSPLEAKRKPGNIRETGERLDVAHIVSLLA